MIKNKFLLNNYIDYTLLKPDSSFEDIIFLCNEAIKYNFYSICINPFYVSFAKNYLKNTNIKICTVIGFPLGMNTINTKKYEILDCLKNGADEFDMVMNISALKSKNYNFLLNEINECKKIIKNKILKIIIEIFFLNDEEIIKICKLLIKEKIDFIKTSTGFKKVNFLKLLKNIKLIKKNVKNKIKIKASGGIKNKKNVISLIRNGADRIGMSTNIFKF